MIEPSFTLWKIFISQLIFWKGGVEVEEGAQAVVPPTLLRPLSDPRLRASPCDRLRMRTKPVMGPSSPAISMLRLARASSPVRERSSVVWRLLGLMD